MKAIGRESQEQDAVGERQPVAAGVQLTGQVTVLGQNRSQHWEAVEGGVGGQHQDQRGDECDQVEPERKIVKDRFCKLRDQRLLVVVRRRTDQLLVRPLGDFHAGRLGQHDDAHEQAHRDDRQATASVVAALRDLGFWKAGTPLLMASTPVSAALPDENARATRNTKANPSMSPCSECISKPADSARNGVAKHVDLERSPRPA